MADVVMPQLGETVTEGTITRWLKNVGDSVARDEALFEVSTDKVDSEVPAPSSGVLAEILVPEGATVPVGARLAVISEGGSEAPTAPPSPPEAQQAPSAPPSPPPPPPAPPAQPSQPTAPPAPAPPAQPSQPTAPPAPAGGSGSGLLLSPVVRRLVAENGLDPAQITGTGPGGRITRDDVLRTIESRARQASVPAQASVSAQASVPAQAASPSASQAIAATTPPAVPTATGRAARRGDEVVPFSNIRRRTAEHMVRSRHTSAHTLAVMEVDFEEVERVRRTHGLAFRQEEGFSLTYLPFVIVATVEAIRAWPQLNSSVGDDALIVHHDINIGIAVDLDAEGLIVPVIHDADGLRLRALARAVRDLAERARSKKLTADDVAGGTFTITNPGPFGTLLTAPIINQPQVAILSTDGVKRRPVALTMSDGTEAVAIHSVGNLALSFDHRVIDGALAARFLRTMKEIVEGRDWEQEL
jgi:pyruvate dehydrogenase E2 component (dihydrolipoamide acetyltransferase)